jgi:hypothetical protein
VGARKKDKMLTIYSITLFFLARKLIIEVRHPVKGGLPPGEFFPFSKETESARLPLEQRCSNPLSVEKATCFYPDRLMAFLCPSRFPNLFFDNQY